MGDKIKVSATVIPRNIHVDKDKKTWLQVEVALNPHLPDSKRPPVGAQTDGEYPDDWGLGYYREILHWYRYAEVFNRPLHFRFSRFDSKWNSQEPVSLVGNPIPNPAYGPDDIGMELPAPLPPLDQQAAEQLWKSMFTRETIVSGWSLDELPYTIAARLSTQQMEEDIRKVLDRLLGMLLTPGRPDEGPNDAVLALHLTAVLAKEHLIPQIFSDPLLSQTADSRLSPYMDTVKDYYNRYSTELDELHHELALHEQQSANMDNTSEFHKKFSAYSAHAYLLYKTGWLWTYQIDISSNLGDFLQFPPSASTNNDNRVFISIANDDELNYRAPLAKLIKGEPVDGDLSNLNDPFYFNFLEEVKFLYPLTAIRVLVQDGKLCKIFVGTKPDADAPNDRFLHVDPEYGYIMRDNVDISAGIIDRRQMMDQLDAQFKANQTGAGQGVQDGGQQAQSRDVSNAIRDEHTLNAAGINAGSGTEYTNNGITIAIRQLDQVVSSSTSNTPTSGASPTTLPNENSDIEGTGIIYLHHMMAGFRVDVAGYNQLSAGGVNDARLSIGSLCTKMEYYYTDSPTSKFCIQYPKDEKIYYEGWLGISAQGSNGNKLFIDQEIGRWNNWSLVCMRLGDDHAYISRPGDGSTSLTTQVIPPERSMVPQRFGWSYSFALRPADICGGGPLPVDQQLDCDGNELRNALLQYLCCGGNGLEHFWTAPIVFQRVDSIPGPALLRGTRLFDKDKLMPVGRKHSDKAAEKPKKGRTATDEAGKWIEGREGEDTNNLVIRSYFRNGVLTIDTANPSTTRYLGPPPATLDLVVQHGALDNLLHHSRATSWSEAELKEVDGLVDEVFQLADEKMEEYSYLYIDNNREIDYLYDPLATGLELSIDNEIHRANLQWGLFRDPLPAPGTQPFPYLKDRYWRDTADPGKNNRYYRLTLADKPLTPEDGRRYLFHPDANLQATIHLRQGCELDVQARCLAQSAYNHVDLFYPGVVRARSTGLKIIHAVEKPCLIDAIYETGGRCKEVVERGTLRLRRSAGATDILVSMEYERFPVLTTESYFLYIQYIDLVGDKTAPLGYRLVKTEKLVKSNIGPTDTGSETNVAFAGMTHSLDRTIHRMANYRIEAISRFKKYFTPHPDDAKSHRFSVYGILRQDFVKMDPITDNTCLYEYNQFVQDNQWHIIPSTKRPDKPVIDKIIPVMEWVEKRDSAASASVERINRKVRIYLQDWHSSGANEKLAILFKKDDGVYSSGNTLTIDADNKSTSMQGAITQFGLDPIVNESGAIMKIDEDFFSGLAVYDFIRNIPLAELQFPGATEDLAGETVCAALYDIQFFSIDDLTLQQIAFGEAAEKPKEGKYYVDILVDEKYIDNHYFPFLRFPIARYQANSLLGKPGEDPLRGDSYLYRMSEVVLTDFVQLLPYRKVTIKDNEVSFITHPVARSADKKPLNWIALLGETDQRVQGIYDTTVNLDTSNEHLQMQELVRDEISFVLDTSALKAINILEYENYVLAEPGPPAPGDRAVKGDDAADPRNDYHKRLVFAYTHQLK